MPAERLSMRKIHEILRLKFGHGLSNRDVALSVAVSRSTVADYLLRAQAAGVSVARRLVAYMMPVDKNQKDFAMRGEQKAA